MLISYQNRSELPMLFFSFGRDAERKEKQNKTSPLLLVVSGSLSLRLRGFPLRKLKRHSGRASKASKARFPCCTRERARTWKPSVPPTRGKLGPEAGDDAPLAPRPSEAIAAGGEGRVGGNGPLRTNAYMSGICFVLSFLWGVASLPLTWHFTGGSLRDELPGAFQVLGAREGGRVPFLVVSKGSQRFESHNSWVRKKVYGEVHTISNKKTP